MHKLLTIYTFFIAPLIFADTVKPEVFMKIVKVEVDKAMAIATNARLSSAKVPASVKAPEGKFKEFEEAREKAESAIESLLRGLEETNQQAFGTRSDTFSDWLKRTELYAGYLLNAKRNELLENKKCLTCLPLLQDKYNTLFKEIDGKIFLTSERREANKILKELVVFLRDVLLKINKECDKKCA